MHNKRNKLSKFLIAKVLSKQTIYFSYKSCMISLWCPFTYLRLLSIASYLRISINIAIVNE